MKKVVSFIILVLAIGGISFLTVYTLNHREVKEDIKEKINRQIENVTFNMTENNLSEIYNVYLNNQRHKLKLEYNITFNKDVGTGMGDLVVYIDGGKVISENVINNIEALNIDSLFMDSLVDSYVRIDMNNLEIIKENNKEYLLIKVGSLDKDKIKEKYYLFNDKGESLINNGIFIRDDNNYLVDSEDNNLNIFYDVGAGQVRVKREGNTFYALVLEEVEKKLVLNEYKYYFKDDKLEKELISTHQDIKIKENE